MNHETEYMILLRELTRARKHYAMTGRHTYKVKEIRIKRELIQLKKDLKYG